MLTSFPSSLYNRKWGASRFTRNQKRQHQRYLPTLGSWIALQIYICKWSSHKKEKRNIRKEIPNRMDFYCPNACKKLPEPGQVKESEIPKAKPVIYYFLGPTKNIHTHLNLDHSLQTQSHYAKKLLNIYKPQIINLTIKIIWKIKVWLQQLKFGVKKYWYVWHNE